MRRLKKVAKYALITVLILVVFLVVGLNAYYHMALKKSLGQVYPEKDLRENQREKNAPASLPMLPAPHSVKTGTGVFTMPVSIQFVAPTDSIREVVEDFFKDQLDAEIAPGKESLFKFELRDDSISQEGYVLKIEPNSVVVQAEQKAGFYYALITFKHLLTVYNGQIPAMEIRDYPDLPVRGYMLDISRDKVPKLETLFHIVDLLSDLKYNHFQLYIEGFSFAYPTYKELWEDSETPLTGEEIRQLDQYCKKRFIDLVPNQNCFGHMAAWLETERFADLAECPKGFNLTPFFKVKTTLDPYDPRSLELVENIFDDLLPNFTSVNFNPNLDEPFEVGHCKSKAEAKEKGKGTVYLEYVKEIHALAKARNLNMMMWGDFAGKHPEIVSEIPKDITLLDWGYEADYPYAVNAQRFQDAGLEFMLCPGTSSWTTISGRTDNMMGNISSAVDQALEYGAKGILLTDWGDMGHWQHLPVSYPGIVFGGGKSWNAKVMDESLLKSYLNTFVFQDSTNKMADIVLDLGRYNQFEEFPVPNMTLTMLSYQFGLVDRILYESVMGSMESTLTNLLSEEFAAVLASRFDTLYAFQFDSLWQYLERLELQLQSAALECDDSELVKAEFANAIQLIRLGVQLKYYIREEHRMERAARIKALEFMKEDLTEALETYQNLWPVRNKAGGLERSIQALKKLDRQLHKESATLQKNAIVRGFHQLKKQSIAATAALFL